MHTTKIIKSESKEGKRHLCDTTKVREEDKKRVRKMAKKIGDHGGLNMR
jgi:hypothetical protein